jgi:hypothetical protein
VAAFIAVGGCDRLGMGKVSEPVKPPEIGRYVIVHSPQVERDVILLDTVTGKTWSRVELSDVVDEPVAWEPMPQLNTPADLAALTAAHGMKAQPPPKAPPAGGQQWPGTPTTPPN